MTNTNKKGKYRELLLNIGIFSLASVLSKGVMFFLLPLYTNILSTSEYGTVELMMTGINLLTPVLTLSISDAVVRFGLDSKIPPNNVFKAESVALLLSSIIMVFLGQFVRYYRPLKDYSSIFIVSMIIMMFRSNYTFYLKSTNNNKLFAIDSVLYTLVLALTNLVFLVCFGMGINGYMLSLIVSNALSVLFVLSIGGGFRALKDSPFDIKLLKSMVLYSSPMILNALSWWIINSSDKYMLEYYRTSSEVGIYSAASKIPALIATVNSFFSQAWTLSSVKEYEGESDRSFFKNIFSFYSFVMFFSTSFILLITKPFMRVYVGVDFFDSWQFVPVLLIASLFGCFSNYFGSIYVATKKNIRCTVSTVICGTLNIVLNFILIPQYGIWGATIATAISFIVIGVYRMIDCQRLLFFPIDYSKYSLSSVLLLIQSIAVIVSNHGFVISIAVLLFIMIIYRDLVVSTFNSWKKRIRNHARGNEK